MKNIAASTYNTSGCNEATLPTQQNNIAKCRLTVQAKMSGLGPTFSETPGKYRAWLHLSPSIKETLMRRNTGQAGRLLRGARARLLRWWWWLQKPALQLAVVHDCCEDDGDDDSDDSGLMIWVVVMMMVAKTVTASGLQALFPGIVAGLMSLPLHCWPPPQLCFSVEWQNSSYWCPFTGGAEQLTLPGVAPVDIRCPVLQ